ncbi:MAG: MmcQ/YjbR family DNA-binding protein [Bacteroidota bacterium]
MTIDFLRQTCLSLPGATEDIKYDSDLCFSIGPKIFCGTRIEGAFRAGFKCDEEDFATLMEREGIIPLPRLSKTFWVRVEQNTALSPQEWEHYLRKSYQLVVASLPKKKQQELGLH